jgi:hypothetical protein
MNNNTRVAAIVVTKDRLNYLKKFVQALKTQNRKPDEIFVINNASNDDTEKWLDEQEGITVIHQESLSQYPRVGHTALEWQGNWNRWMVMGEVELLGFLPVPSQVAQGLRQPFHAPRHS